MTSATAWLRPLTATTAGTPTWGEVRGSHCRTSQTLFTEWAARLGFPGHFGHNWDALADCLRGPEPAAVVIREAGQLLADEPGHALSVLVSVLGSVAGTADDGAEPQLLILLDDTADGLAQLSRRLEGAGCAPVQAP